MNIRDISNNTGFSIDTIRYYEKIGLINNIERKANGLRVYKENDLQQIKFIKKAKNIGFTLKDIHELLLMKIEANEPCDSVHTLAKQKLKIVDEKLKELKRIHTVLNELIGQCAKHEPTEHCPILRVLEK